MNTAEVKWKPLASVHEIKPGDRFRRTEVSEGIVKKLTDIWIETEDGISFQRMAFERASYRNVPDATTISVGWEVAEKPWTWTEPKLGTVYATPTRPTEPAWIYVGRGAYSVVGGRVDPLTPVESLYEGIVSSLVELPNA
jgi:hypothetical protein